MNPLDLPISAEVSDQSLAHRATLFERLIGTRGMQFCAGNETAESSQSSESASQQKRVTASVAWDQDQLNEALSLVRQRYEWRGYCTTDLASDTDRAAFATTIIAETKGATVGTLTLGFDGPDGLLVEGSYPNEVGKLRSEGRRVCELTKLALAEQIDTKSVLGALFGLAYAVGRAFNDVTDVFIEVNPRHVAFYQRLFGFVVEAGERICDRVKAPSVLLRLDVTTLEEKLPSLVGAGAAIKLAA